MNNHLFSSIAVPLLSVKIERNENRGVSANKPQQVTCRAVGSSPPPRISWWKAGTRLQASHETVTPIAGPNIDLAFSLNVSTTRNHQPFKFS